VKENEILSWEKRITAWDRHTGIKLEKTIADWPVLRGFIEVRNALQHGLGHLTDMQLGPKRHDEVLSWIGKTGVTLHGDLVRVDELAVERCRRVCAEFVVSLDTAAPPL
jgi:hypothetical protein